MKTSDPKSSKTSQTHNSKPFFNKGESDVFFSLVESVEKPFFSFESIQPKLSLGAPDDPYEKEADKIAKKVVFLPENNTQIQKQSKPETGDSLEKDVIHPLELVEKEDAIMPKSKGDNSSVSSTFQNQLTHSKGSGSPLKNDTNAFMSNAIGADFGNVRVHTNQQADELNESIKAKAFTHGSDIYFQKGQYNPNSSEGKELLAHELTHVVQQSAASQEGNKSSQIKLQTKKEKIQRDLRSQHGGDWPTAINELTSIYEGGGGIIVSQKNAVINFTDHVEVKDPPSIGEQILLGAIDLALDAALGGLGKIFKAAASNFIQPVLKGATRATFGTAVDSADVRSALRESVDSIIDKIVKEGKKKVSSAVENAWVTSGSAAPTPALQFRETQMAALTKIAREQVKTINSELGKLATTEDENDEWEVANALYAAFENSLDAAYEEQYNKMTDTWFTMQTEFFGLAATKGVLRVLLESRYPHEGVFQVSKARLSGTGNNQTIRDRIANRPLNDILIPKIITMNGKMGHGILDCSWAMFVSGAPPESTQPVFRPQRTTAEFFTVGPQRVTKIQGRTKWGLPWLSAFHLGLDDLDREDSRNNWDHGLAAAKTIWNEIQNMSPREVVSDDILNMID